MKSTNKSLNKRSIVSLILFGSLFMMPVSAVIVHVTHGKIISHTWLHLHVVFAVTFIVAGIYHVVFNWRTLKCYLLGNNRQKN